MILYEHEKLRNERSFSMKKRVVSGMFVACTAMMAMIGCNNGNEASEEKAEVMVSFDAYGYTAGLLSITESDEVFETGSMSIPATEGDKIGTAWEEAGFSDMEVKLEGDTFEGWMEYEVVVTTEEDGFEWEKYVRVSDDIYTTEEAMERIVPDYNVIYVAKWESISMDDYFAEEYEYEAVMDTGFFVLYANGGTMNFEDSEDSYEMDTYSYWLNEGETLDDAMSGDPMNSAKMVSIEKLDAEFDGWTVYESDNMYWSSEKAEGEGTESFLYDSTDPDLKYLVLENCNVWSENATIEEMSEIVYEGLSYYAVANWK